MTSKAGSPHLLLSATEGVRTLFGLAVSLQNIGWALPATLMATPQGEGRPVMLLPGFGANEKSLKLLDGFLSLKGYTVYDWQQGRNLGPKAVPLQRVAERVRDISALHDGKPVSLVGQSLGGTYAAAVAAFLQKENLIDRIITLGSPINSDLVENKQDGANVLASFFFDKLNPPDHMDVARFMKLMREIDKTNIPDIAMSCLYSHYDGVVSAEASQTNLESPNHENINISPISHLGMGISHRVNHIIADRLAEPIENRQPYSSRNYGLLGEAFTSSGMPTAGHLEPVELKLAA